MSEPSLDIIIGGSAITRNKFSANYSAQACAFPSGGFLSIITLQNQERHDIVLSETTTSISALSFSRNGNHIAVGEAGSSSRVFILSFDDEKYDHFAAITIVNTKEKGFTCVALDSENGKLITVGLDQQPFFLLWDLKKTRPTIIGYYHLPCIPTHISIGEDIALISGEKMLKVINLSVDYKGSPALLTAINANIGAYKSARFVAVAYSTTVCYALTSTGTLCSFNPKNLTTKKITLKVFNTNRGNTTSISLDDKLIVCGTVKGSILGIKREFPLNLFGQFSSSGKSVVAVGILSRSIVAAYSDGYIIFWLRKLKAAPKLLIPNPRGPICSIAMENDSNLLYSAGNDGFIRCWSIEPDSSSSKSSQKMEAESQLNKFNKDLKNLGGIRCIVQSREYIYAGDDNGNLYKVDVDQLNIMSETKDNNDSVLCIAAHPKIPLIATGGGDGAIRIYNTSSENKLILSMSKQLFSSPVSSLIFTQTSLVAASSENIKFCRLPDLSCEVYSEFSSTHMFLSLAYVPQAQLVLAACQDMNLYIFCNYKGKVFRKIPLSNSDFPVFVTPHPSGLVYAVAMSGGHILILDSMSGDIVVRFQTHAGMITGALFHLHDIVISSFNGCLMRWNLPESLHKVLENAEIGDENDGNDENQIAPASIYRSIMNSQNPPPQWIYNEISDISTPQVEEEIQDAASADDENLDQNFDEANQNHDTNNENDKCDKKDKNNENNDDDDDEDNIENIIRRSFSKRGGGQSILEKGMKLLVKKNDQNSMENEALPQNNPKVSSFNFEMENESNEHEKNAVVAVDAPKEKTKKEQMNELANKLQVLMKNANNYLSLDLVDSLEISAQNDLKAVVNEVDNKDEEFETKYNELSSYVTQLKKNTEALLEYAQKAKKCSKDISDLVESL